MPRTETTRKHYEYTTKRYSKDRTDQAWAVIPPLLPGPNRFGHPRQVDLRDVWDAIGSKCCPEDGLWTVLSPDSENA